MSDEKEDDLRSHATEIVASFVSKNSIRPEDVPGFIRSVFGALAGCSVSGAVSSALGLPEGQEITPATPAQIKKSIMPDGLISFIDGKVYKTLKRHINKHKLEPASYRQRFGLPHDYPMVCENYSNQRKELAKKTGLGRGNAKTA